MGEARDLVVLIKVVNPWKQGRNIVVVLPRRLGRDEAIPLELC
jgi:hypothetical protein